MLGETSGPNLSSRWATLGARGSSARSACLGLAGYRSGWNFKKTRHRSASGACRGCSFGGRRFVWQLAKRSHAVRLDGTMDNRDARRPQSRAVTATQHSLTLPDVPGSLVGQHYLCGSLGASHCHVSGVCMHVLGDISNRLRGFAASRDSPSMCAAPAYAVACGMYIVHTYTHHRIGTRGGEPPPRTNGRGWLGVVSVTNHAIRPSEPGTCGKQLSPDLDFWLAVGGFLRGWCVLPSSAGRGVRHPGRFSNRHDPVKEQAGPVARLFLL